MTTAAIADNQTNPFAALGSTGAAAAKATDSTSASGQQDRFLKLLVAQMKNQDPLNPQDNAQLTSQMAQISTVDGIEKLNRTVQQLTASNESSQAIQGAALVGRNVLADGNGLALAGGLAEGGFDLPQGADQVTITVAAPSGQVVHRATLDNLAAGIHTFAWDGNTDAGSAAENGSYSFSIKAVLEGKNVTVNPLSVSRVDGVSNGSSGMSVRTSSGTLDWSKIRQVM